LQVFRYRSVTAGLPKSAGQISFLPAWYSTTGDYSIRRHHCCNRIAGCAPARWGYSEYQFPEGASYILGKHPEAARYVLVMGGIEAAETAAAYKLEHRRHFVRLLGHGLMIQGTACHIDGAAHNFTNLAPMNCPHLPAFTPA
jgi:hypothetical protein